MLDLMSKWLAQRQLPAEARRHRDIDNAGLPETDPGCDAAIVAATNWLCRAHDRSASNDGGVARDFSLISGWATSYPETTGYIVPTFLELAPHLDRPELRHRARRMLDWLQSIQLQDGGFQGGRIDARPVVSVTFNTGQILLGLAAGVKHFGAYEQSMHRAAIFLRDSLDDDGCWRRHPTPFAARGDKAYETHVAWALFEAERLAPGCGYADAAMRQVRWAMSRQQRNGWVADCCLNIPDNPLTHTLGYYLKGLVEAHRWGNDGAVLACATRTATGLLQAQRLDGALPGRLTSDWRPAANWSCLTGNVQIADCWFYLGQLQHDERMLEAARRANRFVRRTIRIDGPDDIKGGVKGSFPVSGDYGAYEFLNWAAKFTIESNLTESSLLTTARPSSTAHV
jgi:hypothetical protein